MSPQSRCSCGVYRERYWLGLRDRLSFSVLCGYLLLCAGREDESLALADPGSAVGIAGWLLASVGLRVYVHFFQANYTVAYGELGAVIVLLTWFYLTGLMLLIGAEINSEIEAVAAAKRLLVIEQNSLAITTASGFPGPTI